MKEGGIHNYFTNFINKESLFKNKTLLTPNYHPQEIQHRDEQVNNVASILAPCLKQQKPSNLFIYGKTGTGKTLVVKYVSQNMQAVAKENNIPLKIIYINCKLRKSADTEYRLLAYLARTFGKSIPSTGLPTEEIYNIFYATLEQNKQTLLIILDEIDQLMGKSGNEILYNLTRINSELKQSQISLVGISNDLVFTDLLDPRVKSSLSEEEIVFPPYNAPQLQTILQQRAAHAFKEGVLEEGLIEKCAAYAAREHGDSRRAIELLRVAAEIAERSNQSKVTIQHIDEAEKKIENDRILDLVSTQPIQQQLVLYAIILVNTQRGEMLSTGEIYDAYQQLCTKTGQRPLTQRRISDIISEFDMLGIINAKVISKGRYGRTREITLTLPSNTEQKIINSLQQDLHL